MEILNDKTELVSVKKLKPHPQNPRKGNVAAITESIKENGFYGVIVAQKSTGYVLVGNHRLQAAKEAGAKEVPVTWLDVDDRGAAKVLLVDNKLNDKAGYDNSLLKEVLGSLEGDFLGSGYNIQDYEAMFEEVQKDQGKVEYLNYDYGEDPDSSDGEEEQGKQIMGKASIDPNEPVESLNRIPLGIFLEGELLAKWYMFKKTRDIKRDQNAFEELLKEVSL
jgi:hypothetical protein